MTAPPDAAPSLAAATLILRPDPALGFVVVNASLPTGSRHDPPGKSGLAHVVEHVICGSSGKPPQASTAFEHTDYLETGPPGALPDLLDRAADRLRRGADDLTPDALERHRRIVLEEINQREAPAHFGSGPRRSLRLLFGADHPYARPPLGLVAEIESVTVADVQEFIAHRCTPDRAVISVVGAFDPLPPPIPRPSPSIPDDPVPPAPGGRRRQDVEEGQPTGMLRYAFALPPVAFSVASVTMAVLAGAPWSLLGAAFAQGHRALATDAHYINSLTGPSIGLLKVSVPPGVDLDDVDAAVAALAAELARTGPAEDVLAAAKALRAKEYLSLLSSSRSLGAELCRRAFRDAVAPDAPDPLDAIRAVRAGDVALIAAQCLAEPAVIAFHAAHTRETSWIV